MNDRPITEFFRPIPGNGFYAPMYRIRQDEKVDRWDGARKLWELSGQVSADQLRNPKLFVPVSFEAVQLATKFGFGI